MGVEQMRYILYQQYGGAFKWVNRVRSMSDSQVIAIYFRMLNTKSL